MTGINTGPDGCPLDRVGLAAIDNILEIGTEADIVDTKCAYLAALELCGRACLGRGICLGINLSDDAETLTMRRYIELFELASNIGVDCETVTD